MSGKPRARSWSDLRAEAIAGGHVSEESIAKARFEHDAHEQAYHLGEIRRNRARSQNELAAVLHISQARVSEIERGQLASCRLGTLRAYIEALGGELRIVAEFGDDKLPLLTGTTSEPRAGSPDDVTKGGRKKPRQASGA